MGKKCDNFSYLYIFMEIHLLSLGIKLKTSDSNVPFYDQMLAKFKMNSVISSHMGIQLIILKRRRKNMTFSNRLTFIIYISVFFDNAFWEIGERCVSEMCIHWIIRGPKWNVLGTKNENNDETESFAWTLADKFPYTHRHKCNYWRLKND